MMDPGVTLLSPTVKFGSGLPKISTVAGRDFTAYVSTFRLKNCGDTERTVSSPGTETWICVLG